MNQHNPYTPPNAELETKATGQCSKPHLFSPSGRFNRSRYLLFAQAPYLLLMFWTCWVEDSHLLNLTDEASTMSYAALMVAFLIGMVISLFAIVQRLHDLGLSGFLALLTWIPIANLAMELLLALRSGTEAPNHWGLPNCRCPKAIEWLAIVICCLSFAASGYELYTEGFDTEIFAYFLNF